MRIGLLSDTHGYLDPKVFELFAGCDEIWHAGDFGSEVSESLGRFKPLRGVYGNIDDQQLRQNHPEYLCFMAGSMTVLLIHIGGTPGHYYPQARQLIETTKPDIFICGHSHILKVMKDTRYNLLYLNPGAAGKQGFHRMRTMLRFEIREKVENLEVIELGLRAVPA